MSAATSLKDQLAAAATAAGIGGGSTPGLPDVIGVNADGTGMTGDITPTSVTTDTLIGVTQGNQLSLTNTTGGDLAICQTLADGNTFVLQSSGGGTFDQIMECVLVDGDAVTPASITAYQAMEFRFQSFGGEFIRFCDWQAANTYLLFNSTGFQFRVPNAEPDPPSFPGAAIAWVDEVGNTLNFKVIYSDNSTVKSVSLPLI